jgi:2,3-bisphosphoglycerate-dependent phosphoglycerate mutase
VTGTRIIIARHGNTFGPGDTPTRVGARTDLGLVDSGRRQGEALGQHLVREDMKPAITYSAVLKRTRETAELALAAANLPLQVLTETMFNEIDYGPDENKTEAQVVGRIGGKAIDDWNKYATVPDGWSVDAAEIKSNWHNFSERCLRIHCGETVLVVTSNGIARFAPFITGDFDGFAAAHDIKLSTGAVGVIEHIDRRWQVTQWNVRPDVAPECGTST